MDEHARLTARIEELKSEIAQLRRAQGEVSVLPASELLAEVQRIARLGHWEHDVASGAIRLSEEAQRIVGAFGAESLDFQEYLNWVHPGDRDAFALRASRHQRDIQYRIVRPDGEVRTLVGQSRTVLDDDGNPVRRIGTLQDVTEQHAVHEALRASELRYRTLASVAPVGIFRTNADGDCIFVSERWSVIAGISAKQARGAGWVGAIHPADRERVAREWYASATQGVAFSSEYRLRAPDGRVTPVLGQARAEQTADGETAGYVGTITDLSAQKKAEAEQAALTTRLRHAEKLQAVGTLASGLAHNFNNLLVPVLANAEMMRDPACSEDERNGISEEIIVAATRGKELVKRILRLSSPEIRRLVPSSLSALVRESTNLLRPTLATNVRLEIRLPDVPPTVLADPSDIHQILLNVYVNGIQAMSARGGLLEVDLTSLAGSEAAALPAGLPAGAYAQIMVRDGGTGISADVLPRIFDPFFSTKATGEGTGFGLATAYSLVAAHAGAITVESAPGAGSTFRIFLPLTDALVETTEHGGASHSTTRPQTVHVLLVDDDPAVARVTVRMLRRSGFEVESFLSPADALERFGDSPQRFHVALLDQTMPKMNGLELARALLSINPRLPVALCTGISSPALLREAKRIGVRGQLAKPYTRAEMVQQIESLLTSASLP